jgi:hypothetical protein
VTRLCQSGGFAAAVVTIVFAALVFGSSHCTLAAVNIPERSATEHACCHSDKGAAQEVPAHSVQCCKELAAPLPSTICAPAAHLQESPLPLLQATRLEPLLEALVLGGDYGLDTGPPANALSFALLILNRSLLVHAPPQFA